MLNSHLTSMEGADDNDDATTIKENLSQTDIVSAYNYSRVPTHEKTTGFHTGAQNTSHYHNTLKTKVLEPSYHMD